MTIKLYENDMSHLRALKHTLGESEFERKFPGLKVWVAEVDTEQRVGIDGEKSLAEALNTEIPEKSIVRALEEMIASNERLSAENRRLQIDLSESNSKATRNALVVAILGVIATLLTAVFF